MKGFAVNDIEYSMSHDCGDDSRTLFEINLEEVDFKIKKFKIDSDLWVSDAKGNSLGRILTSNNSYVFKGNNAVVFETNISVNNWHWDNLLQAEIETCKFLLSKGH